MSKHLFRRSLGLVLALMLVLAALPVSVLAAQTENAGSTTIELAATDVELDETIFEYTGEEIRPNVTVRVQDQLLTLDKDYLLEYADNIEIGEGKVIVTGIATSGYSGNVEIPFYINEKAPEFTLVTIQDADVTINGTEFDYTGQPIEPAVTVTIDDKTLTPDQDYAIEYINNLVPGTGTVIIRGIATASDALGYTGEVRKDFTILPLTEETYPLVEIQQSNVTMDGTSFLYTGKAIEPEITVTIDGKELTSGKDYSVTFENNVEPGTATAIIRGIATATEFGGYTGEVKVTFTIEPRYAITKGDGAVWNQNSGETLSFTVNGASSDFDYLTVDGKTVPAKYYTIKEGSTILTLKNSFLNLLDVDTYEIVFHYVDGEATGTFKVAEEVDASNPKTGDGFPLHLLSAVMFVSLTGMIGAAYTFRKKIRK